MHICFIFLTTSARTLGQLSKSLNFMTTYNMLWDEIYT